MTAVGIRDGHDDITRRGPLAITKIKVVEGLKDTELSPVRLSGIQDVFDVLDLLLALHGAYHLCGLLL